LKLKSLRALPSYLSITKQILNLEDLRNYVIGIRQREPELTINKGPAGQTEAVISLGRLLLEVIGKTNLVPTELENYID